MIDAIDSPAHYRQTLQRVATLKFHRAALYAIQAQACADIDAGALEAADMRDLAAIDDALADLGYTVRCLEAAIADWDACLSYGGGEDPAGDRAWYRRRLL